MQRAGVSGAARWAHYEIRVEGILDPRRTGWFEGLRIDSDNSQTVISGPVADQAALHGLLYGVCDLGVVLMRPHIPVSHALVADFEAIAPRYPVFRVARACDLGGPLAAARPPATDHARDQGE
jgi:hypothetical protein